MMDMWNESLVTLSRTLINGTALEMQELSSSADPLDGNATDLPLDVHSLYEHTPPPYSILSVFVIILLGGKTWLLLSFTWLLLSKQSYRWSVYYVTTDEVSGF